MDKNKTYYLFIPWQREDSGDMSENNYGAQSNWEKDGQKMIIVYHGDKVDNKFSALSAAASKDVAIYVLGHGLPGVDSLSNTSAEGGPRISHQTVCDNLVNLGIKADFAGKIKFFSCYSANGDAGDKGKKFEKKDVSPNGSFAEKATSYMTGQKGIRNATYFGYTWPLAVGYKYYKRYPGGQTETHKYLSFAAWENNRNVPIEDVHGYRAKEYRIMTYKPS